MHSITSGGDVANILWQLQIYGKQNLMSTMKLIYKRQTS